MASKGRFPTQCFPQHNFASASLYHFHAVYFFRLINRYVFFPLSLSRLAGLIGLTLYYGLIPKHTAGWRKACSPLQCMQNCLYMPVNHRGRFSACMLFIWCLSLCESFMDAAIGDTAVTSCPTKYSSCLTHFCVSSSQHDVIYCITIRVSAPWCQFVFWGFLIVFHCFSALSVVAHGHLMRSCCVGVVWWQSMWPTVEAV